MYKCKNYRPEKQPNKEYIKCDGKIVADLYDEDGKFYRSAIVADLGITSPSTIRKYCEEQNRKNGQQA